MAADTGCCAGDYITEQEIFLLELYRRHFNACMRCQNTFCLLLPLTQAQRTIQDNPAMSHERQQQPQSISPSRPCDPDNKSQAALHCLIYSFLRKVCFAFLYVCVCVYQGWNRWEPYSHFSTTPRWSSMRPVMTVCQWSTPDIWGIYCSATVRHTHTHTHCLNFVIIQTTRHKKGNKSTWRVHAWPIHQYMCFEEAVGCMKFVGSCLNAPPKINKKLKEVTIRAAKHKTH